MLEYLAAGDTFEDLLAEFPDLEREDLQACLQFATQSLKLKSRHLVLEVRGGRAFAAGLVRPAASGGTRRKPTRTKAGLNAS